MHLSLNILNKLRFAFLNKQAILLNLLSLLRDFYS